MYDWYREKFRHTLSLSTIAYIISPKYAKLDGGSAAADQCLQRPAKYPVLEEPLNEWLGIMHGQLELRPDDNLLAIAQEIWSGIQHLYPEQDPIFSRGWLHKLKKGTTTQN